MYYTGTVRCVPCREVVLFRRFKCITSGLYVVSFVERFIILSPNLGDSTMGGPL